MKGVSFKLIFSPGPERKIKMNSFPIQRLDSGTILGQ